jgi:hypothetical protein
MMVSSWIWQQPDWPRFRWQSSALEPLLEHVRAARQELLSRLERLEPPLDREAISALLGRESLGTAAIEGELLDVLLEATSTLDEPLTLVTLNHWHQRLFAAGPDGLRAIRIQGRCCSCRIAMAWMATGFAFTSSAP